VAAATILPTAPTQFEARRPKIEIDINLVMLSDNYCPACCPTILFPYNTKTRQVFLQKLPAAHCNFPIKGIFFFPKLDQSIDFFMTMKAMLILIICIA